MKDNSILGDADGRHRSGGSALPATASATAVCHDTHSNRRAARLVPVAGRAGPARAPPGGRQQRRHLGPLPRTGLLTIAPSE